MKIFYSLIVLVLFLNCNPPSEKNNQQKIVYDFDESKYGLSSPKEIALGVIDFLKNADLELAIPLKAQQYLFEQNFEYRPDIKNRAAFMDSLASHNESRINNFLVRSKYIHEIMIEDKKFDIGKATIDTIGFKSKRIYDYGGFDKPIVANWIEAIVVMNYKGERFYFEVPQIMEVKGKWFLYYPEYYLRDIKERAFVEMYLKLKDSLANELLK